MDDEEAVRLLLVDEFLLAFTALVDNTIIEANTYFEKEHVRTFLKNNENF